MHVLVIGLEREERRVALSSGLWHHGSEGQANIQKKAANLHALACVPGCTSWIYNNRTAGIMAAHMENQEYLVNCGNDDTWTPFGMQYENLHPLTQANIYTYKHIYNREEITRHVNKCYSNELLMS